MPLLAGLRILALAGEFPPYRGGIGTYAYSMAQAATELGAEVTVVAPDYGGEPTRDDAAPFQVQRFKGGVHTNRQLLGKTRLARAAIRQCRYDIVHAVDWPFFIPVALTAGRDQRRIFTIYGTDVNDMARWKKRLAVRAASVLSGRSEIVAISDYTLGIFRDTFPSARPLSLRCEPLAAAEFWRVAVERSAAARTLLHLPTDKFVIVTVGRVIPRKGQVELIAALSQLAPEIRHRLMCVVVGTDVDKGYAARLNSAIAGADFDIRRLVGIENEELRSIYANADVFCLVGQDVEDGSVEGFGLVYLEAASQGLPSIAGATGAVPEVVQDGVGGLLLPTGEAAAVCAAVTQLVQDTMLRDKLATGARQRALDFSWQRCAGNTYASIS